MNDWFCNSFMKVPHYSGGTFFNFSYWLWRWIFNRPYKPGKKLRIVPPTECAHWIWMFPGPLVVVGREWIKRKTYLYPGYIYKLKDVEGNIKTFHEMWLAGE